MILPVLLLLPQAAPAARPQVEVAKEDPAFKRMRDRFRLDFEPPRMFEGLWVDNFEGQRFLEAADTLADLQTRNEPSKDVWFERDEWTKHPSDFRHQYGHVYRVRFMGRKALPRRPAPSSSPPPMPTAADLMQGGFVLVDDLIEMTDLGPFPKS